MSSDERDQTQRSLGFMGLSAFAHIGLLILVLLAPSFRSTVGAVDGSPSDAGIELNDNAGASPSTGTSAAASGDAAASDAAAASSDKAASSNDDANEAPHEVLLADANGPNAVELPSQTAASQTAAPQAAAAAQPTTPIETPAAKSKAATAAAKPAAKPIAAAKTSKAQTARFEKAAAVKSQDIVEVPNEVAPANGDVETKSAATPSANDSTAQAETSAKEEAAADAREEAATKETESAQTLAANETPAEAQSTEKAVDQTADDDDDDNSSDDDEESAIVKKQEPAVPLTIALPENESLTEKQAQALQAPKIPSNAKPIETVESRVSNSNAPAASANASTAPTTGTTGAILTGRPGKQSATLNDANGSSTTGTANSAGNGQPAKAGALASRGGGTNYAVPLGAPLRDARSLIAMPGNAKPVYPLADKMAGRQGTAVLVGKITAQGDVETVVLEKSSGSKLMDESAAKAFKSWRYRAGQEGYVRLPVQFQLVGDAETVPSQLRRQ